MRRFPPTAILCLLALALLSGGCATVRKGVVVAKGSRVMPSATPPIANYWVDVRGRDESGAKAGKRVLMFKADWEKVRKGDSIALEDFGRAKLAEKARPAPARLAESGKKPPPVAERLSKKAPAPKREAAPDAEARAHEDAAVREAKRKIHSAATPEEQGRAWEEYRSTLERKTQELAR